MFCSEMDISDIDQYADYSDDEDEICIRENELIDFLSKLEETNLFKMNLIQEQKQTLEKIERESKMVVEEKAAMIVDVENNLKLLEEIKAEKVVRLSYYKSMMDANNAKNGKTSPNAA
jgi:hypothetical protein